MTEYTVTHEQTGRLTVYPDAAAYEAAWDWFEAGSHEDAIAWYSSWDQTTNQPPRNQVWQDEARTILAADWADAVTAAYAWTFPDGTGLSARPADANTPAASSARALDRPEQPRAAFVKILRHRLSFETVAPIAFLDVTQAVRDWVTSTGVRDGVLTLISPHTTARVNVNESEARLQRDMITFLKRLVPQDGDWLHNLETVDDRPNAHAHLLGLFMTASETIPVANGALTLGDWQSIFFIELDGPRPSRQLDLQIMGTA